MNILSSGEECSVFMFQRCFGESAVIYISPFGFCTSHLCVCSCVAHVLPPACSLACLCMSSYVIPFVYKSVFSFLVVVALVRVLNKILFKILLVVQLLQLLCAITLHPNSHCKVLMKTMNKKLSLTYSNVVEYFLHTYSYQWLQFYTVYTVPA